LPIGGPFNPSLSQINIDDIDHIEIVKGPQGTLYGVAAFAGMVQVFTKSGTAGTTIRLSGGSFDEGRVDVSTAIPVGRATLKVFGNFDRADGWQDRTDYADDRGGFRLDTPLGDGGVKMSGRLQHVSQHAGLRLAPAFDPPTGEVIQASRSTATTSRSVPGSTTACTRSPTSSRSRSRRGLGSRTRWG
jgi:outer membrane cobalamin receptor